MITINSDGIHTLGEHISKTIENKEYVLFKKRISFKNAIEWYNIFFNLTKLNFDTGDGIKTIR